MNVDLFVVGLVAVFAIIGAFTGAAKQIATLLAAIAAGMLARGVGPMVGPRLARELQSSQTVGIVLATLLLFLLGFLLIRGLARRILLRILAGKGETEDRSLDRALGFLLGGLRVAAICWFVICALAFLEDNVSIAGKRLSLAPQGSVLFQLARNHNFFAMTTIPGMRDLVEVAKSPKARSTPEYGQLRKDPRFRRATDDDAVKKALETGDYRALMQNTDVVKLLNDAAMRQQLEAAIEASEK
ncbi:MAG: CvpA family protein [Archangiaceae bacterium]|nr:CvpA family protein [Archangiaceae bacterium]